MICGNFSKAVESGKTEYYLYRSSWKELSREVNATLMKGFTSFLLAPPLLFQDVSHAGSAQAGVPH
jgi:hypothetical protein